MSNEQYFYMQDLLSSSPTSLGLVSNATWHNDPKRLLFSLSRYKFVSKMLKNRSSVLEVGCGDGWNSRLVSEETQSLTLTDMDPVFVDNAFLNTRSWTNPPLCKVHDFLSGPLDKKFDSAYALDVLEHIPSEVESLFIENIKQSCLDKSIVIFGMPSLESQQHIDPNKRDPGHINCKSLYELSTKLTSHFSVVLPFSMNDEVLHTGHAPMSNYIFSVCIV